MGGGGGLTCCIPSPKNFWPRVLYYRGQSGFNKSNACRWPFAPPLFPPKLAQKCCPYPIDGNPCLASPLSEYRYGLRLVIPLLETLSYHILQCGGCVCGGGGRGSIKRPYTKQSPVPFIAAFLRRGDMETPGGGVVNSRCVTRDLVLVF